MEAAGGLYAGCVSVRGTGGGCTHSYCGAGVVLRDAVERKWVGGGMWGVEERESEEKGVYC